METFEHTKDSTFKTRITIEQIQSFLDEKFSKNILNLMYIKGGESSQAFSFEQEDKEYILRVNRHDAKGFNKDKYAHEHFSSEGILIPEIIEIGQMSNGNHYAISEKAQGKTIAEYSAEETESQVPTMLNVLDEIHAIDVSKTTGYGYWNPDSTGDFNSWNETILAVATDPWRKWDELFANRSMEKDLYDILNAKLKELIEFCPEDKSLIHGDYGWENLLSDGKKVTGVIDWSESRYGDFIYDVAWMTFWPSPYNYGIAFDKHFEEKKVDIPNYKKRILCYQVYIALNSLGFYAYSNQKEKYQWAKDRITGLIK
jgi:hygromycin-B 4-O-kinase